MKTKDIELGDRWSVFVEEDPERPTLVCLVYAWEGRRGHPETVWVYTYEVDAETGVPWLDEEWSEKFPPPPEHILRKFEAVLLVYSG